MSQFNVLLVEDDPALGFLTKYFLDQHDYNVTLCASAEAAWKRFQKTPFDICLCDVLLPKQSGLELIKMIRQKNTIVPIVIVSSSFADVDRIAGMECGADAFIPKPYNLEELRLRMQVFLKKKIQKSMPAQKKVMIGNCVFDYIEMTLTVPDMNEVIALTNRENDLLWYLCDHTGHLIKKEDVLMEIWGNNDRFLGRSLDVFINKIRKYFRTQVDIELKTIHGIGYKFNCAARKLVPAAIESELQYSNGEVPSKRYAQL